MAKEYEVASCKDCRLWRDSVGCLNGGGGLVNVYDDDGTQLEDECTTETEHPDYDELIAEYERKARAARGVKPIKKQATFRLSESTIKQLETLARRTRVSQADVIAILVHAYEIGEFDEESLDKWFDIAQRT